MAQPYQITPLPRNLYSGGAVVLNPHPIAQTYMNLLAHRKAQQDATMRYMNELGSRLTPQGMVDEDAKSLIQKKNDFQDYVIRNKDAISNTRIDNGEAWSQSMRMYNDMLGMIAKSKNKAATLQYLKPILDNPSRSMLLTNESRDAIHRGLLPVTDPDHKDFTPDQIHFKDKPFDNRDIAELQHAISGYTGSMSYDSPVRDEKTGTQTTTGHRIFGDNEKLGFQHIANNYYQNHPGFKYDVDNVMSNPQSQDYQAHNDLFKKVYGRDMDGTGDVATAYLLSYYPHSFETSKSEKTVYTPEEKKKMALDIAQGKANINLGLAKQKSKINVGEFKEKSDITGQRQETVHKSNVDYNLAHPKPTKAAKDDTDKKIEQAIKDIFKKQ